MLSITFSLIPRPSSPLPWHNAGEEDLGTRLPGPYEYCYVMCCPLLSVYLCFTGPYPREVHAHRWQGRQDSSDCKGGAVHVSGHERHTGKLHSLCCAETNVRMNNIILIYSGPHLTWPDLCSMYVKVAFQSGCSDSITCTYNRPCPLWSATYNKATLSSNHTSHLDLLWWHNYFL